LLSRRAARKHLVASRLPKYFLRPRSAGSVSPGSGRPVRRKLGYGPAVRLKPFRPHLTVSALSCADSQQDTPAHGHRTPPPNDAQRGVTPAFGYGPRLGPVRLDFHQLVLCAARRTLRDGPPAGSATVLDPSRIRRLEHSLSSRPTNTGTMSSPAFPRSPREPQTGFTPPLCRTPPGQYMGTRQTHPG
jgi:hypothetical protein